MWPACASCGHALRASAPRARCHRPILGRIGVACIRPILVGGSRATTGGSCDSLQRRRPLRVVASRPSGRWTCRRAGAGRGMRARPTSGRGSRVGRASGYLRPGSVLPRINCRPPSRLDPRQQRHASAFHSPSPACESAAVQVVCGRGHCPACPSVRSPLESRPGGSTLRFAPGPAPTCRSGLTRRALAASVAGLVAGMGRVHLDSDRPTSTDGGISQAAEVVLGL